MGGFGYSIQFEPKMGKSRDDDDYCHSLFFWIISYYWLIVGGHNYFGNRPLFSVQQQEASRNEKSATFPSAKIINGSYI